MTSIYEYSVVLVMGLDGGRPETRGTYWDPLFRLQTRNRDSNSKCEEFWFLTMSFCFRMPSLSTSLNHQTKAPTSGMDCSSRPWVLPHLPAL